jgi:formyl-CoA transferase
LSGLHAAVAGLSALHHRDATGEGQHVDVALLDSIIYQSNGYLTLGALDGPLDRWGSQVRVCAPTNCYECVDGYVYLALILDSHWVRLCDVIGQPELGKDPRVSTNNGRLENREEVDRVVAEWCLTRSKENVIALIDEAGIVVAPVNTFAEAARDPHILDRDMLQNTVLPTGESVPLTGPAAKFSRTPARVRHCAPIPAADTDLILTEIGVSRRQLDQLREAGIVG